LFGGVRVSSSFLFFSFFSSFILFLCSSFVVVVLRYSCAFYENVYVLCMMMFRGF